MHKILSLVLSFALIWGSVSPSFANMSLIEGGAKLFTGRRIPGSLTKGGVLSGSAGIRVPALIVSKTVRLNNGIRLSSSSSVSVKRTGSMHEKVSRGVVQAKQPVDVIDVASLDQLTDKDAVELLNNSFSMDAVRGVRLTDPALELAPYLWAERKLARTAAQHRNVVENYRYRLGKNPPLSENPPTSKDKTKLKSFWYVQMTAVSDLGLFGTAEDADLILRAYSNAPAAYRAYSAVFAGRALLNLKAYGKLEELAAACAENGRLTGEFWAGLKEYAREAGLPVTLPEVTEGSRLAKLPKVDRDALKELSVLNRTHFEHPGLDGTREWAALCEKQGKIIADEAVEAASVASGSETVGITGGVPLSVAGGEALNVAPLDLSSASGAGEKVTAPASAKSASQAAAPAEAPAKMTAMKRAKAFFSGKWRPRADNSAARRILSQIEPPVTLFKQIIESQASNKWKEQAFVRLYERGALRDILEKLPQEAQNKLVALYQNGQKELLGKRLLSLYNDGIISESVSRITNARNQQALVEDLDQIVGSTLFAAQSQAAYDIKPVVRPNFNGAVPPVPKVDKEEVINTFRENDPGWADRNRGASVEKDGKLYFKNKIPFYYRNSRGQLSSKPVGILSQEEANWYGRFLSKIGLADTPGMAIEQGFVLALDEMGQWKLVMPNGNRAIVEANPKSKKLLEEIQKNGSKQVAVNTPYSSSDLLAMANMLEHKPNLNLELVMSAPDSMNRFLAVLGSYIGLDSAGALTGPFKATLKGLDGLSNMMGNLVGGVGYLSPWAGGAAAGLMKKKGSIRSLDVLLGASIGILGYALLPACLGGLGMTGFQGAEALQAISLEKMALPMVTAVFAASLLGTQMNVFLNYFKDPVARTSAHLRFAETKQWSRLGLVGGTAILTAAFDANWSVVVPVALGLATLSAVLLRNTPVYRDFKNAKALAEAKKQQEEERLAGLTPQERAAEEARKARFEAALPQMAKLYKPVFRSQKEIKDIAFRVKMVYASYAASLMMLGQSSTELFGSAWGQGLVGAFMLSTAMMRRFATKMVSGNKMTDDQLTGMSVPLLALTGAGLAVTPYAGAVGLGALGLLGIAHYVATAVPGQLDAARLQNLVSAELAKRKQAVEDYEAMTAAQRTAAAENWDEMDKVIFQQMPTKEERLELLEEVEKDWASKATRDYSYFNGHGLAGILVAAGAGYLFMDLGPQWTKGILDHIGSFVGDSSPMLTLNRMILAYAAGVAGVLAWKNWGLTKDFFSLFNKKKITTETVAAGQVSPKDVGMTLETKDRQLAKLRKELESTNKQLLDYGVNSERKLTKHLQTLVRVHNRFAAAQELELAAGATEISTGLKADFTRLQTALQRYKVLLETNDPSIMLQREFETLANALCEDGLALTTLRQKAAYMPEGSYSLPAEYAKYDDASQLVDELNQLAGQIRSGDIGKNTYRQFISYQTRVNDLLAAYKKANPADSVRVLKQQTKLNAIINELKKADAATGLLEVKAGTLISPRDVQELRDVLAGYAD